MQQVGFALVVSLFQKGISKRLPASYTCVCSLCDLTLTQLRKPEAYLPQSLIFTVSVLFLITHTHSLTLSLGH